MITAIPRCRSRASSQAARAPPRDPGKRGLLTFLSSSLTWSTESALMPPSPPVTEVPSIEGSGASPLSGARYSWRSRAEPADEVADDESASLGLDECAGEAGRLETGDASSAAKLILDIKWLWCVPGDKLRVG